MVTSALVAAALPQVDGSILSVQVLNQCPELHRRLRAYMAAS